MSYRSWIESLPPPLQRLAYNPTWWAAIASVGLHGLFFILLPFISLPQAASQEPDIRRQVSLVELTPQELGRVPDFSTPDIDLPPIPDGSDLSSDEFFSFDNIEPPPPAPRDLYNPFRINPPIPIPFSIFDNPPPPDFQPNPNPQPPPEANPPQSTGPSEQTEPPEQSQQSAQTEDQPQQELTAEEREALARARQQELLARNEELQQQFAYNPPDEGEVRKNYQDWNRLSAELGFNQGGLGNLLELQLPYPVTACVLSVENDVDIQVQVSAFVDETGTLVEEPKPQILQRSGFEFFDNEALGAIANYEFDQTGQKQAYVFQVIFDRTPESCSQAPASESPPTGEPADDSETVS